MDFHPKWAARRGSSRRRDGRRGGTLFLSDLDALIARSTMGCPHQYYSHLQSAGVTQKGDMKPLTVNLAHRATHDTAEPFPECSSGTSRFRGMLILQLVLQGLEAQKFIKVNFLLYRCLRRHEPKTAKKEFCFHILWYIREKNFPLLSWQKETKPTMADEWKGVGATTSMTSECWWTSCFSVVAFSSS